MPGLFQKSKMARAGGAEQGGERSQSSHNKMPRDRLEYVRSHGLLCELVQRKPMHARALMHIFFMHMYIATLIVHHTAILLLSYFT